MNRFTHKVVLITKASVLMGNEDRSKIIALSGSSLETRRVMFLDSYIELVKRGPFDWTL